jgi:hypothetical protein
MHISVKNLTLTRVIITKDPGGTFTNEFWDFLCEKHIKPEIHQPGGGRYYFSRHNATIVKKWLQEKETATR